MRGAPSFPSTIVDACPTRDGRTVRSICAALLPCFLATVILGSLSDGAHHDDDLAHYLMARWARWFPEYLLHIWARPGLTWPLASVAWIGDGNTGWPACRVLSAMVTAGGAFAAALLAHRWKVRRPWLVVLACYLQPLNSVLAYTTLTENFAALYLVAALLLFDTGRSILASLVFSLVLVSRHEMIVLIPIWWIALAIRPVPLHRRAMAIALSLWAPVIHNIAFHGIFGSWPIGLSFAPSGSTEYLSTGLLTYVPRALVAIPPVLAGLALLGGARLIRRGHRLGVMIVVVYFATHCAVTTLGVFASGGFARFMVTIAPLVGILCVAGLDEFFERVEGGDRMRGAWSAFAAVWIVGCIALVLEHHAGRMGGVDPRLGPFLIGGGAVVAAVAVLMAVLSRRRISSGVHRLVLVVLGLTLPPQVAWFVRPLKLDADQRRVLEAVTWLRSEGLDDRPIFATDPWFSYFLEFAEDPTVHKGPRLLAAMPVGTIVVWDSIYSDNDFHGVSLDTLAGDDHYQPRHMFGGMDGHGSELRVFEKVAVTPVPIGPDRSYPPNLMTTDTAPADSYYRLMSE